MGGRLLKKQAVGGRVAKVVDFWRDKPWVVAWLRLLTSEGTRRGWSNG